MTLKERAKQLKLQLPIIFVSMKHKETPILAKIVASFALIYALSPIDLIPDFIPVLGLLDDIIILPFLIVITLKLIPLQLKEIYQKEVEEHIYNEQRKKWVYAIPFIIIWIFIIYLLIKVIISWVL